MKPPFLWLGRTRLDGIISPPYPEVTLDNFGLPVGGRLAACAQPRLPKVALLGSKNAVFYPKSFFCGQPKKNVTIMMGHLKDNLLVLNSLQGGLRGAVRAYIGPKNLIVLRYTYITHLFLVLDGPDSMGS